MSLGKKLLLGGLALVIIPVLAVGIYSFYRASSGLRTQAVENAGATAIRAANQVQTVMEGQINLMTELASGNTARRATKNIYRKGLEYALNEITDLDRELGEFMETMGQDYEMVFVADHTGQVVSDGSGGKYKSVTMGDREYFKEAMGGQASMGHIVKSEETGLPLVVVAVPVRGSGDQVLGVAGATLKLDFWNRKVANIKLGQTGILYMVDQKGIVLAHPDATLVLEANVRDFPGMADVAARILEAETGVMGHRDAGSSKITGFAPVQNTPWRVLATQDEREILASVTDIRNGVLIIGLVFLGLAAAALALLVRQIARPVNNVAQGLDQAAGQVASAANMVASASHHQAEGASRQAANLEETTASLEELSSMTQRNAENANQANQLMRQTTEVVVRAGKSMSEMNRSMEEISDAGREIGNIIKTIDEIAFQTNLLALNAAVEAARAGDAGAGFAVVAEEVRNLAQKAAGAARDTATLIESTISRIDRGTELVRETETGFSEISDNTERAGRIVGDMAVASNQQAQGIDQIRQAVQDIDQITQGNAAGAEETASASEDLNIQANTVLEIVEQLKALVGGRLAGNVPDNVHQANDLKVLPKQLTAPGNEK
jgi:methyl-accepting chemotaxis protein